MQENEGWDEWGKHVRIELERLAKSGQGVEKQLINIRLEISTLKAKAAIWGAGSAAVVTAIGGFLYQYYTGS